MPERIGDATDDIFTLNQWSDGEFHVEQLPCWLTDTNAETHDDHPR